MARPKTQEQLSDGFERLGDNAAKVFQGFAGKVKELEEKKRVLIKEINNTYAEAKKNGFDTKPFKEVIRRQRMADATRIAFVEEVKKMENALGMLPLFEFAEQQDKAGQSTEADADAIALH